MKIRTRLTLWYAGMLFGSLLLMGGVLHHELVGEYDRGGVPESPSEKISDILLFYGLPTVIMLILGGSWIIRRALRPLENLTATASRVHAGNLTERIPFSNRGDELDMLAGVVNEMLARVESGIAGVREFTIHASHELKTPLTILSAETELALDDPATPDGQRERLASQFEEIRRLASLVDALAILAKADAGLPVVHEEFLRFDEMLRIAVEDARVLAAPQGIAIELTRCDEAGVRGDPAGIRQVLLNLLSNAVKHNHPDGQVAIDLRAEAGNLTLAIRNTGSSIPPELQSRIFDRFVRGPGTVEGAGLGLSITKTILEAHGGTIVSADCPEGGALFVVNLPGCSSIAGDVTTNKWNRWN